MLPCASQAHSQPFQPRLAQASWQCAWSLGYRWYTGQCDPVSMYTVWGLWSRAHSSHQISQGLQGPQNALTSGWPEGFWESPDLDSSPRLQQEPRDQLRPRVPVLAPTPALCLAHHLPWGLPAVAGWAAPRHGPAALSPALGASSCPAHAAHLGGRR